MFSIRAVVRWEALRNKSFYSFDENDKEDIVAILYTSDNPSVPYEEWTPTDPEGSFDELNKAIKIWGQYIPSETEDKEESVGASGEPVRISDLVADLVVSGSVDARWAYEEMTLLEMDALQKALQRKQRYELEDSRLWTFLSIIPHIAGGKVKTPKDLYPFPWEEKEEENHFLTNEELEARLEALKKQYYE